MCSYHGWEFKGSGACTNLPHAPTPDANARACSNPRSCVASYPVQVRQASNMELRPGLQATSLLRNIAPERLYCCTRCTGRACTSLITFSFHMFSCHFHISHMFSCHFHISPGQVS